MIPAKNKTIDLDSHIYKILFDLSKHAFFLCDEKLVIVETNNAASRLLGHKKEDLISSNFADIIPNPSIINMITSSTHRSEINYEIESDNNKKIYYTIQFDKLSTGDGESFIFYIVIQDITEKKREEIEKANLLGNLNERVKELNCLFTLSEIVEKAGSDLSYIFEKMVGVIPGTWLYPENTCARIFFDDDEYRSKKFKISKWSQKADIYAHGKKMGCIEVYYFEEKPFKNEDPFLSEERNLLNALAERFGRIAERCTIIQKLSESEEKFRTISYLANDAIIMINQFMAITFWNETAERLFLFNEKEVFKRNIVDKIIPDWNKDVFFDIFDKAKNLYKENFSDNVYELVMIDANQKQIPVEMSISFMEINNDFQSVIIIRDISERREMEKKIIDEVDRVKAHIGRDLHDGVGQVLTGTGFMCELLTKKLRENSIKEAMESEYIYNQITEAKAQVKMLAKGLSPIDIGGDGFIRSIEQLCSKMMKIFNIKCSFFHQGIEIQDDSISNNIYYIIQESMLNAVKHGQATLLEISITNNNDYVIVSIKDDGTGFNEKEIDHSHHGIGLSIMKYRAGIIGATLQIKRSDRGGMAVICTAKLKFCEE